MRYANISQARQALRGNVIVWYQHRIGGSPSDRHYWLAEKDGLVIDYGGRDALVRDALAQGEQVFVLRIHRDGTVSACLQHRGD